ncbi:MAG: hypothetical protein K0Q55_3693 [Verrucomicrobia bacterium]|nr:hypothetical protein [Verrucomicrobiota bacterium]
MPNHYETPYCTAGYIGGMPGQTKHSLERLPFFDIGQPFVTFELLQPVREMPVMADTCRCVSRCSLRAFFN